MELHCENYFCIYEDKNKCMLDDVHLDIQGNCLKCIYVDIDYKILEKAKEKANK